MEPGASSGATREAIEPPARTIGRVVQGLNPASAEAAAGYAERRGGRGASMRPSLRIMDEELLGRIVVEAKRGLLEHGLPLDHSGTRVLFPRDVVEAAIASAPSSFTLYDREGNPHADLG